MNFLEILVSLSVTTITSIMCIVLLIIVTIWLSYRDTVVKAYVDKRLQTLKEELNKLNLSQFNYDQEQENKLVNVNNDITYIKKNYIPKKELETELKANIVTAKNIKSELINASNINIGPTVTTNTSCPTA